MPRQPRYFIPGFPQHVVQRGVDRQAVFFRPDDYERYLDSLSEGAAELGCDVHAYVLMTNHVHLLVTPRSERALPLLMQAMGREYVQALNRQYRRTSLLWQSRYQASLIQDDRYLLTCHRYIELNPVRAGMVEAPGEYPYSSYRTNALGRDDRLIVVHAVYRALGRCPRERQARYRQLFPDHLDEELREHIRQTTNACRVLATSDSKIRSKQCWADR